MKFEKTEVWGFEHAIRGMRNPMNSWDKSDSYYGYCEENHSVETITPCNVCDYNKECSDYKHEYNIGENDLKLMQKLIRAGSEHRKFLRQIIVSVDITAPMFWWSEFDTYKVGTTANSTSKMHKLASTPITLECFETDDYDGSIEIENGIDYSGDTPFEWKCTIDDVIDFNETRYDEDHTLIGFLERLRQKYLETKDKKYWKELLRWLPTSWLQTRTVTMNYENILSMYRQRKNHKLNEWSGLDNPENPNFVAWVKSLPYAEDLICIE